MQWRRHLRGGLLGLGLTLALGPSACSGGTGDATDAGPDAAITIMRSSNALDLTEGEAGKRVSFQLDGPLSAPLVVSLVLADPAMARVEPPELTFRPGTSTTPQEVLITAVHDDDGQGSTTRLSATAPGARGADVDVYIADNDDQQIQVSPATLTLGEGQTGTVNLRLSLRPAGDIAVTLTAEPSAKLTLTPNLHRFTTANFSTPFPVTVQALQDADSSNDTITISVVVDTLGRAVVQSQVTIVDDD